MAALPPHVRERALALLRAGKSTREAAQEAGASVPAVTEWAHAAGVKPPNRHPSRVKDRIREALRREPNPLDRRVAARIAAQLDCHVMYVVEVRRAEFGTAPAQPRGWHQRKATGLCPQCFRRRPAEERVKCSVCLRAQQARNHRLREITAHPLRRRSELLRGGRLAGLSIRRQHEAIDDGDDRAQLARIQAWAQAAGIDFDK
jgi:hypothetical protein